MRKGKFLDDITHYTTHAMSATERSFERHIVGIMDYPYIIVVANAYVWAHLTRILYGKHLFLFESFMNMFDGAVKMCKRSCLLTSWKLTRSGWMVLENVLPADIYLIFCG